MKTWMILWFRLEYGNPWPRQDNWIWRLAFVRKSGREYSLIDYTRTKFYAGKPACRRLTLFGLRLFHVNRQYSGLPRG